MASFDAPPIMEARTDRAMPFIQSDALTPDMVAMFVPTYFLWRYCDHGEIETDGNLGQNQGAKGHGKHSSTMAKTMDVPPKDAAAWPKRKTAKQRLAEFD